MTTHPAAILIVMEIAILDIGSTSFHLEHFRFGVGGSLDVTLDIKETLRLGAQVFDDGFINSSSWDASMETVGRLVQHSRRRGPDHQVAVATSAVRCARNGRDFTEELTRRFGLEVGILAPQDEARLAYLGATTSEGVGGRRALVLDLGGGSLELALGAGTRCEAAFSLPLGAVRLRTLAAPDRFFDRDAHNRLVPAVRSQLGPNLARLSSEPPEVVVFASGTARAARQLAMRHSGRPGKTGPVDVTALRMCLDEFVDRHPDELLQVGVPLARRDTVLVAAAVMVEVMDALGITRAETVDRGMRDGMALQVWRDRRRGRPEAARRRVLSGLRRWASPQLSE